MRILVTGGAGFLGRRLIRSLLDGGPVPDAHDKPCRVESILSVDVLHGADLFDDPRVSVATLDLADPEAVQGLFGKPWDAVFHLAAVVSAAAEADFILGLKVNVDATRLLLEACRLQGASGTSTRFVLASSVAVFGGMFPAVVSDSTAPTPQGSYGTQKLIAELLLQDYTRKGFLDGRAIRIPTIVIRPGQPNGAASGFASSIMREPLAGRQVFCPVAPDTAMWIASPGAAVAALIRAQALPKSAWSNEGALNLPGLSVTIAEMIEALRLAAGRDVAARVLWQPDARIEALVRSWPARFDPARAHRLGFRADPDFHAILAQYRRESGQ